MQPLIKRIKSLSSDVQKAIQQLNLDDKQSRIHELEDDLAQPEIWNNPDNAQDKSKKLASLNSQVEPWTTLQAQIDDIEELMELGDDELLAEFERQVAAMESDYAKLKQALLFDGEYDE